METFRNGKQFILETANRRCLAIHIERPAALSHEEKEAAFSMFYPVALAAFSRPDEPGFAADVREHLFESNGLVLVFDVSEPVPSLSWEDYKGLAFLVYDKFGDIFYLSGVAIQPSLQGKHLCGPLIKCVLSGSSYIVARTQNPAMVAVLDRLFGPVAPVTSRPDKELMSIASFLAVKLAMKNYDHERMLCRRIYSGRLGKAGNAAPEIVNGLNRLIDADAGDAVLAVCRC